jgi:hypothetical protein
MAALNPQVDAQLKPVLRNRDFAEFDLARAFSAVAAIAAAVSALPATEGHGSRTANARPRTKPRF